MKAEVKDGACQVRALITHKMETGLRKDGKGNPIPAHYITEVTCEHAGNAVMTAQWGPSVSQNPYLAFRFDGAKLGDTLKLSWVDNQGKGDSTEETIK
jgi:sulfur-oxidizing protein SoxZ